MRAAPDAREVVRQGAERLVRHRGQDGAIAIRGNQHGRVRAVREDDPVHPLQDRPLVRVQDGEVHVGKATGHPLLVGLRGLRAQEQRHPILEPAEHLLLGEVHEADEVERIQKRGHRGPRPVDESDRQPAARHRRHVAELPADLCNGAGVDEVCQRPVIDPAPRRVVCETALDLRLHLGLGLEARPYVCPGTHPTPRSARRAKSDRTSGSQATPR